MSAAVHNICFELQIHVLEKHKEMVSDILNQLEVGDFVYGEMDVDLEAEYDPSKVSLDLYDVHQNNPPIIIYNENAEYLESIQKALEMLFPKVNLTITNRTFVIQEIADQNWRESWKHSFQPVLVGEMFAVLPPWEHLENFSQKHKIVIDPGMAFGTGQHETTRLCLEVMSTFPLPKRFFDVGTGSGLLAIAAKKLGTDYVYGNDIDPDCLPVAKENVEKNSVSEIHFSNLPVNEIQESNFDMIVANIQSRPLKILVPEILKRLSKNGTLILSGILVSEKDDFKSYLDQQGAEVVQTKDLNHWCAIVCRIKKDAL